MPQNVPPVYAMCMRMTEKRRKIAMEKTNAASAAAEKSGKKKKRSMLEGSPDSVCFYSPCP